MKIGIIGAGNMGSALCAAFVSAEVEPPEHITLSDPNSDKLEKIASSLGVQISSKNEDLLDSDMIILAVKPQAFPAVSKPLKGQLDEKAIVISIMAGVSISNIQEHLGHDRIVRAMPNTPALVNLGVIGWYAHEDINDGAGAEIQRLLETAGYAFRIETEEQIDDVTALSGCGPGFFFYLFDQWMKAGQQFNLPQAKVQDILLKTLQGSLKLLEESEDSPQELAQKVASKGGATEQGLKVLEGAQLEELLHKTMKAAYHRCKELG